MNEQKLDLILAELGKLNTRMTSMEERMTSMEERMTSMEERMASTETRIMSLEAGQRELNQIVTAIRDRQDETDAKLEALTMDIHKMHGELTQVKETVAKMDERLTAVEETVARIEDTMVKQEDLKYYDQKIAEHDRYVYNMKNKVMETLFEK